MPNSEFLTVLRQEIADVEARLDALRRAESELLKTNPQHSPTSEQDAIKTWNPIIVKKTKTNDLVVSFLVHYGKEQVHRDTLFRALTAKGARLGGSKNEGKRIGNLKACLTQNPDLFNYDPLTGMVSMKRR